MTLASPFVYFGGKRAVADVVWERFGNVDSYVEPFAGSAAVLFARPDSHRWWQQTETINDADGFVANFWRALQADPKAVAHYADLPVNETDMHGKHAWLVGQCTGLTAKLEGDPEYYDAKIAGWWVWGLNCWIGGGWCSGQGPWHVVDGLLVKAGKPVADGVWRQRVHLGADGRAGEGPPHATSSGEASRSASARATAPTSAARRRWRRAAAPGGSRRGRAPRGCRAGSRCPARRPPGSWGRRCSSRSR